MTLLQTFLSIQVILYIDILIRLFIFRQISGLGLRVRLIVKISLILWGVRLILLRSSIFLEPFFLLAVIPFLKTDWNKTQKIFYGLLPAVISDMFMRVIGLYLRFLLNVDIVTFNNSIFFNVLLTLLLIPFYHYFFKGLGVKAEEFEIDTKDRMVKNVVVAMNTLFLTYLLLIRGNLILEIANERNFIHLNWDPYFIRTNILLIYFVLFTVSLLFLNYRLKEKKEEEIQYLKDRQLTNLSQYSRYVESLYRDIRSFRHDYTNILVSLNEAIKAEDISQIKSVYQAVIADSDKQFYNSKYDIAELSNIQNDAMKSLLSAKMLEAQNKGIAISVEVASQIDTPDMELIDFITMLSILLDNATEAAAEVRDGRLGFAYFVKEDRKIMVIENSIQEESVEISSIYDYGISSKGVGRGIGLANVKTIVNKYPNVSLSTNSYNHQFIQELTFFEGNK